MQQLFFIFRRVLRVPTPYFILRPPIPSNLWKKPRNSNVFQKLKLNTKTHKNKVPQEEYKRYAMKSQRDFWCSHQWNWTLLPHLNTPHRGKTEVQPVCGMSKSKLVQHTSVKIKIVIPSKCSQSTVSRTWKYCFIEAVTFTYTLANCSELRARILSFNSSQLTSQKHAQPGRLSCATCLNFSSLELSRTKQMIWPVLPGQKFRTT